MKEADLKTLSQEELVELAQKTLAKNAELEESEKQIRSNSQKGAQLLMDAMDHQKKYGDSIEELKKVEEDNPDLAKILQKRIFDGKTSKELEEEQQKQDEQKEQEEQKGKEQKRLQDVIDQLPEELREDFEKNYFELSDGKAGITDEKFDKLVTATIALIQPKDDQETVEKLKNTVLSPGSSAKTTKKDQKDWKDREKKALQDYRKHL